MHVQFFRLSVQTCNRCVLLLFLQVDSTGDESLQHEYSSRFFRFQLECTDKTYINTVCSRSFLQIESTSEVCTVLCTFCTVHMCAAVIFKVNRLNVHIYSICKAVVFRLSVQAKNLQSCLCPTLSFCEMVRIYKQQGTKIIYISLTIIGSNLSCSFVCWLVGRFGWSVGSLVVSSVGLSIICFSPNNFLFGS